MSQPVLMPKTKLPLEQAEKKDLEYWATRKENEVAERTSKYPDRDASDAVAMRTELARRAAGGVAVAAPVAPPKAPAAAPTALAVAAPNQIVVGTFANADAATRALAAASQEYHLVSPATVVGRLPEGCEVAISLVRVDPYGPEVYQITGNKKHPGDDDTVGIDRVGLARIAAAMGVTWDSSRRTDDGSHPHYCAWEAWATFPGFDLQPQRVPGNVEIDTREDGALCGAAAEEIRSKAKRRAQKYPQDENDGGDSQLLELRKFIMRHAESKAMNKAIGNRGVRRSYKRKELNKAFAVARLMFTGASEDPEARREFRQMIGERFMGSRTQLYGQPQTHTAAPAALPVAAPAYHHSPPPLSARRTHDDAYDTDGEAVATPLPVASTQPLPATPVTDVGAASANDAQPELPGTGTDGKL